MCWRLSLSEYKTWVFHFPNSKSSVILLFLCWDMLTGNTQNLYILASVWSKGFYVLLPSRTISSICWMGWTTASCNGNHPFSSASSNAYLYFTYSWSSRMWPELNTWAKTNLSWQGGISYPSHCRQYTHIPCFMASTIFLFSTLSGTNLPEKEK